MNEEEFESLRRWGEALLDDPRPEVHAAGKAISLLAAEVERVQVELWHLRLGIEASAGHRPDEEPAVDETVEGLPSLLARLVGAARRLQPARRNESA